jgi:hypothetical protein
LKPARYRSLPLAVLIRPGQPQKRLHRSKFFLSREPFSARHALLLVKCGETAGINQPRAQARKAAARRSFKQENAK